MLHLLPEVRYYFYNFVIYTTGNVERSKLLQKLKNRIQCKSKEGAQIKDLKGLLEDGEKLKL
jgi:hypothetical protein